MEKPGNEQTNSALPRHPPSLIIFENPDKQGKRRAGPDKFMPDWPFRLLLCGPPNCGKRNAALNVVVRLDPPPSAIHIVHLDPETTEYDVLQTLGAPMMFWKPEEPPTKENIMHPAVEGDPDSDEEPPDYGRCPLVIIDELTKDSMSRQSIAALERLINFVSSHCNCSVICSIQNITSLQPAFRRGFDNFCLWKHADRNALAQAAIRCGIETPVLDDLLGLCQDRRDFIWVDTTKAPDSEYRFRLNFIHPIHASSTIEGEPR